MNINEAEINIHESQRPALVLHIHKKRWIFMRRQASGRGLGVLIGRWAASPWLWAWLRCPIYLPASHSHSLTFPCLRHSLSAIPLPHRVTKGHPPASENYSHSSP
jgi:hypothetical protein